MTELVFDFEWVDPLGARGAELRATWARLEIGVGDKCVTRIFDRQSRSVRDAVYLPLYPIAEWLATNWWALAAEVGTSDRITDSSFVGRHNLRTARDGYAAPAVCFSSFGDLIQASWQPEVLSNYRVEFIESAGTSYVTLPSFQSSVRQLIEAVVTRLQEQGVGGTLLEEEWAFIVNAGADEDEFCVAAAELGLDPFAVDDETRASIIKAASIIPLKLAHDFFSVAHADIIEQQAIEVANALESVRSNNAYLQPLTALRYQLATTLPVDTMPPWQQGYIAARKVRDILGVLHEPLPSFGDIGRVLGVDDGELKNALIYRPVQNGLYDAVVATNARDSPAFSVNRRSEAAASRFQFARGLHEFLTNEDRGPWLVTRALSERQKMSRAFAAEFLAPADGLRERLSHDSASGEEVDELARYFGVSSYVIVHQIENHNIAEIVGP